MEWNYRPAGFVSYGGISGGLRAADTTPRIIAPLGAAAFDTWVSLVNIGVG
jgi:hypothetical protein